MRTTDRDAAQTSKFFDLEGSVQNALGDIPDFTGVSREHIEHDKFELLGIWTAEQSR
jgi:hypothetical protein